MPKTVRRCMNCGREDPTEQWESVDAALKARAMTAVWACPSCAWPEADLVEASTASPSTSSTSPASAGSADTERAGSEMRREASDLPADPDEVRRRVEASLPFRR